MNFHLYLIVAAALLLTGCLSREAEWSRAEFATWCDTLAPKPEDRPLKVGYTGSDERFHHFIVRPVDSFVFPKIPRHELHIADERPRTSLGKELYFYLVDPRDGFKPLPTPSAP